MNGIAMCCNIASYYIFILLALPSEVSIYNVYACIQTHSSLVYSYYTLCYVFKKNGNWVDWGEEGEIHGIIFKKNLKSHYDTNQSRIILHAQHNVQEKNIIIQNLNPNFLGNSRHQSIIVNNFIQFNFINKMNTFNGTICHAHTHTPHTFDGGPFVVSVKTDNRQIQFHVQSFNRLYFFRKKNNLDRRITTHLVY